MTPSKPPASGGLRQLKETLISDWLYFRQWSSAHPFLSSILIISLALLWFSTFGQEAEITMLKERMDGISR
jgi:hypothetical protein